MEDGGERGSALAWWSEMRIWASSSRRGEVAGRHGRTQATMASVGDEPCGSSLFQTRQRERVNHRREMGKKGKESRRKGEGVWPSDER